MPQFNFKGYMPLINFERYMPQFIFKGYMPLI